MTSSESERVRSESMIERLRAIFRKSPNPVNEFGPERRPDFFCIGTEKAGTTWLWHCMNAHPNIGVPATKELRFFNKSRDPDFVQVRALREFLENPRDAPRDAHFLERVATEMRLNYGGEPAYFRIFGQLDQPVVGELTPQYCLLPPERIRSMRKIAPHARIIYMLRDPVDRLLSGARMVIRDSGLPMEPDQLLKSVLGPTQLALCNAHIHLANYEREFGRKNVATFFFDDIRERPLSLFRDISDFIGAEHAPFDLKVVEEVVNPGIAFELSADARKALYLQMEPVYAALERRFPDRVRIWRSKYQG